MTPDERDEIVKTIVRDTLAERFTPDEFLFGPIVVEPPIDVGDGDDNLYLRILVIFDGDQKNLDPSWTGGGLIRRMRPKLIEAGIEEFPGPRFIGKSEWRRFFPRWRRIHPEVKVETG